MALTKTKTLRKIVRDILAFCFWMHAFYATNLVHLPAFLSFQPPNYLYSFLLVLLIGFYSLLSEYEWFSVLADAFYIYLWPCIVAIRVSWLTVKRLYKFFRSNVVIKSPELIVRPVRTNALPQNQETPNKPVETRSVLEWIAKPFMEFSVLWALLILITSNKFVIVLSSLVALFCAGRSIYELWGFAADASSWIEKLKGRFAEQIATNIGKIRAWEEVTQLDEITNAANALKMLESIFAFIAENKKFLARTTTALAAIVSVVFYCYFSFLTACLYVGLAKLQGISWPWSQSLVTSLYMPFAFTNLPRNFPMQFIGGLQAVAVTLVGYNIFFRHLNSRFERIAVAATELRGSFEDKVLRVKFSFIQEQVSRAQAIVASPGVLENVAASAKDTVFPASEVSSVNGTTRKGFRQQRQKTGR